MRNDPSAVAVVVLHVPSSPITDTPTPPQVPEATVDDPPVGSGYSQPPETTCWATTPCTTAVDGKRSFTSTGTSPAATSTSRDWVSQPSAVKVIRYVPKAKFGKSNEPTRSPTVKVVVSRASGPSSVTVTAPTPASR